MIVYLIYGNGSVVKYLPAKQENAALNPVLGRSSGEGNGYPFSILAWEIPWIEEPGGLQSMGLQKNWTQLSH